MFGHLRTLIRCQIQGGPASSSIPIVIIIWLLLGLLVVNLLRRGEVPKVAGRQEVVLELFDHAKIVVAFVINSWPFSFSKGLERTGDCGW